MKLLSSKLVLSSPVKSQDKVTFGITAEDRYELVRALTVVERYRLAALEASEVHEGADMVTNYKYEVEDERVVVTVTQGSIG